MTAYNVWFSTIASSSPLRFYGAAMIPAGAAGVAEIERCAKLTFRALVIAAESADALPEQLLRVAAEVKLPVLLAKRGSATPTTDFQRFTEESEKLAGAASRSGRALSALVVAARSPVSAPERSVSYVAPALANKTDEQAVWGHLGQPLDSPMRVDPESQGFLRRHAMRLFQLPDIAEARFSDMREARRLAARGL
jgi:hypothetical protein